MYCNQSDGARLFFIESHPNFIQLNETRNSPVKFATIRGMTSHAPSPQPQPLDKIARHLLTAASTLLVLCSIALFANHFYNLMATLALVLVVTYILLGPVNLAETCIMRTSDFLNRHLPSYRQMVSGTPQANPRILAVLIVYFMFFMGLIIGIGQIAPVLNKELEQLGNKISVEILASSDQAINWTEQHLGEGTVRNLFAQDIQQAEREGIVPRSATSTPAQAVSQEEKQVIQKSMLQKAISQVQETLALVIPHFISVVGGTVNGFVYFLAGLLLTFYFLSDTPRIRQDVLTLLPRRSRELAHYLLASFHQVMFAFIKGQVMLGILTGFYMYCVYSFFGVPWAILLAFIFAAAEILPVVGTWIGMGIGLVVILLTMDPWTGLFVWICSYVYQSIKDNILAPKIVGDVMGLHPMVVILSLLIGGKVAGLLGVLLAMPLASALYVILRLLLNKDAMGAHAHPKATRTAPAISPPHADPQPEAENAHG